VAAPAYPRRVHYNPVTEQDLTEKLSIADDTPQRQRDRYQH
jgi:hypothetical protein